MFDFFKRKKKAPKHELRDLLGNFELESFPAVVLKVLELLRDPESSLPEIAAQIEMDPGMHLKVLRMVNAAAFGLAQKVSNLQHAVTIMGRSRLESLVLTFAVGETLPTRMECMKMSQFWLGAARRACLARALAQHLHAASQAESFTAGLLQDMAIPVIAAAKQKTYIGLIRRWHANPESDLTAMERELFGYDHAAIGALMAEDWGLPQSLVDAVAGHHDLSDSSPSPPAVRLVSQIRYLDEDNPAGRLIETATSRFAIPEHLVRAWSEQAFADAQAFARLFD